MNSNDNGANVNPMIENHTARFAPSPTGALHLGHAYAAFVAQAAAGMGGRFLLRMEDTDTGRVRSEYEQAVYDDLRWMGLAWEEPVMRQSERSAAYLEALEKLRAKDLIYPCFCTRKEIEAEFRASVSAPHGPDGPLYPGTCKHLSAEDLATRMEAGDSHALRLHVDRAMASLPTDLTFMEYGAGPDGDTGLIKVALTMFGDAVLARKDAVASYHLAVVVDDAAQGITLVTRGNDLFPSTHLHRMLQALLDLPTPEYLHHENVCDETGKRLAKRHDAMALATLRADGKTPKAVRDMLPALPGVLLD